MYPRSSGNPPLLLLFTIFSFFISNFFLSSFPSIFILQGGALAVPAELGDTNLLKHCGAESDLQTSQGGDAAKSDDDGDDDDDYDDDYEAEGTKGTKGTKQGTEQVTATPR
jgi:hypothetical protein